MSSSGAPFDEKGKYAMLVVLEFQSFPLKEEAVGPFSRAGSRTLEGDTIVFEVGGELGDVARMGGPSHEARLSQFQQVAGVRCTGLLRVWGNDFEIVFFTQREKSIAGAAAGMDAAERSAYAGALFDKSDATVQVVAAEKDVIEHAGWLNLCE